jgi:hypothetical protein
MPLTLDETDYPSIREAISASLDGDTLPDAVIGSDLYLKTAVEWVQAATSDIGEHAKRAAIFYTAHLLVPACVGQIMAAHAIKSGTPSGAINWRALSDFLLARAEKELLLVSLPSVEEEEEIGTLSNPSCSAPTYVGW